MSDRGSHFADLVCFGPPCAHFPDWVKTRDEARDWLAFKTISTGSIPRHEPKPLDWYLSQLGDA